MGTGQVRRGNLPQGMYGFRQGENFFLGRIGKRTTQPVTPGCSELGAGTRQLPSITWGHPQGRGGAGPGRQRHPCLQKGTVGASGTLNPKGEAFGGGLLPLKLHGNACGHPGLNLGVGTGQTVPGTGPGDEGPGILIPSHLKSKGKEQSGSREGREWLGGAGSVPQLGSAPGHEEQPAPLGFPGRGIDHLILDTLEIQLPLSSEMMHLV